MIEEDSANINQDDDSAVFDVDEYINYNDILNPYSQQQQQNGELSFDNIIENLKNIINSEK